MRVLIVGFEPRRKLGYLPHFADHTPIEWRRKEFSFGLSAEASQETQARSDLLTNHA